MRISTSSFYAQQLEMLSKNFQDLNNLALQGMSHSKLQNSYDDPVLARQISEKTDSIQYLESFSQNIVTATNRNKLFDSTMKDTVDIVGKISASLRGALTGTTSDLDRTKIATELKGYLSSLLSKANAQDTNGQYIFSGYQYNSPSFALENNKYVYQGSNNTTTINLGSTTDVVMTESGYQVFDNINLGNGAFVVASDAANTGTASTVAGSVVGGSSTVSDTYTINFVTKSSGKLGYEITGAQTGVVLPVPPADDYPDYVPDADVTFKGISINIKGAPNAGDKFVVSPSPKDNVFNIINDIIATLETPTSGNEVAKAALNQKLNQSMASIDQVFNHFVNYQSQVGVKAQLIDQQAAVNTSNSINAKDALKQLAEPNETELISQFGQQKLLVETTQELYKQMQDLMASVLKNI